MARYSTTRAVLHKLAPTVFPAQAGLGMVRGIGDATGVSLSQDMMLGMAVGAVGVVLYCKNKHKLAAGKRATA